MPLSELSDTNIRRNAKPQITPRTELDSNSSPDAATKERRHPAQSAVQSMLRLSTETGDVGPFSIRPPRVPRMVSRHLHHTAGSFESLPAPRTRKRYSPSPQPSHNRMARFHRQRHTSPFPRHDSTHSGPAAFSSENARLRIPPPLPNHPMRTLVRSAASSGFYSHRSYPVLRNQYETDGLWTYSPCGYSSRRQDSTQRPASPTWSETPRSLCFARSAYNRPPARRVPSHSSMLSRRGGYPGYRSDINSSFPFSFKSTSPTISPGDLGMARTPVSSRVATTVSFPLSHCKDVNLPFRLDAAQGLKKSPTSSATPLYYDYTERFADNDSLIYTSNMPMALYRTITDHVVYESQDVSISRSAQTPFGLTPGSVFRPSELPTKANRRKSERTTGSSSSLPHERRPSEASSMDNSKQEAFGSQVSHRA